MSDDYEVELKLRTDHRSVRERLRESDATPIGRVEQTDTYYDAPDREFAETDEALRIRVERDPDGGEATTRVTYKGPLVDEQTKTRLEAETAVAEREAMERILEGLGYEPAATVTKHRERFALGEYTVTLDTVEGLGEFVEIDREVSEADVAEARRGAKDTLRTLGVDPADGIQTSYLGLLLADDA